MQNYYFQFFCCRPSPSIAVPAWSAAIMVSFIHYCSVKTHYSRSTPLLSVPARSITQMRKMVNVIATIVMEANRYKCEILPNPVVSRSKTTTFACFIERSGYLLSTVSSGKKKKKNNVELAIFSQLSIAKKR